MLEKTIKQISESFINEAKLSPSLLKDMAAMETYLSESYSGRILIELIQNADDACSSKAIITRKDGNIIFANNGRPFNEEDIISISRSGSSNKKRGETIGYRGIGFKSSSFLSSDIIIYSSNTCFTFSRSKTANILGASINEVPTVRIPFNCDTKNYSGIINQLINDGYTTIFIFTKANENTLHDELETFSPDILIFLKYLKEIEILNFGNNKVLRAIRRDKEWGQQVNINNKDWAIIKGCLGFRIEDNSFIECEENEALFHTFLPTLDKSPYLFKINADFSTDPSRKHIILDERTKNELCNVSIVIKDLIKEIFSSPKYLFKNLLQILSNSICYTSINNKLKNDINMIISNEKLLLLNNGDKEYITNYKCFSNEFENSVIHILRNKSTLINKYSLKAEFYEIIDSGEKFLSLYSKNIFSSQEIINILCDRKFVRDLPYYIYSLLLGKVIRLYNVNRLLSNEKLLISEILIKKNDNSIFKLAKSKLTSLDILEIIKLNDYNNLLDNNDLNVFLRELGLKIIDEIPNIINNDEGNIQYLEAKKLKTFNSSTPIIPKWKSSENACVEIEKFIGNDAKDVSKQNLGYDIESITPSGEKRFIEVKSITNENKTFTITNNEYTAAHQYGDQYYICLLLHNNNNKSKAIYIKNPLSVLNFEKRIRQWEWFCEQYEGEEINIDYK